RHAVLRDHDAALPHAAPAAVVERFAEQHFAGTERIGRVDDAHVETTPGLRDVIHAVVDDQFETPAGEHGSGEFGEVVLGGFHHRGVDFHLRHALDRFVPEHLFGDAAVAAANDQHIFGAAVGKQRNVGHHLVIDELIPAGDLGGAVQHQDFSEELVLEQD